MIVCSDNHGQILIHVGRLVAIRLERQLLVERNPVLKDDIRVDELESAVDGGRRGTAIGDLDADVRFNVRTLTVSKVCDLVLETALYCRVLGGGCFLSARCTWTVEFSWPCSWRLILLISSSSVSQLPLKIVNLLFT